MRVPPFDHSEDMSKGLEALAESLRLSIERLAMTASQVAREMAQAFKSVDVSVPPVTLFAAPEGNAWEFAPGRVRSTRPLRRSVLNRDNRPEQAASTYG